MLASHINYFMEETGMNLCRLFLLFSRPWIKTTGAKFIFSLILSLAILTWPVLGSANKSSSMLTVDKVGPNQYTVTVHVEHDGNNFFHYTDWVRLFSNGKEIQRWEYSRGKRPESENFVVTATITITESSVLTSLAHCNIHGSDERKQGKLDLKPD